MKAEELRIGNYIARNAQYLERGVIDGEMRAKRVPVMQWMEIVAIERDRAKCETAGKRYIVETDSLIGIPLTPEWFERFGFEHDQYEKIWRGPRYFNVSYADDGDFYLLAMDEYEIGKPIQYVHQLQNLFYALTGEELALKENVK